MEIRTQLSTPEQKFQGGVITFGNFDGLHLGHQALLQEARRHSGPHIVFTFDPHPVQVLHPGKVLKRLFPREDVVERLPDFGADLLVILEFTREFAALTAEEFLQRYVVAPFSPRHLVVGHDFALGRDREGNLDFLKTWSAKHGIGLHVVAPFKERDTLISSGRIRAVIADGDLETAARWLGRPFYLRGRVIAGDGRGRGLGFPTLNQSFENETLPAAGVYVSQVRLGARRYPAVTNIGVNPTFGGQALKVESFVLSGHIEGVEGRVDLDLFKRLRDERKFNDPQDLKKQIERDILEAKAFHQIG